MSNTKTVMSQAANTLVKPLNVEDVFSNDLFTSTHATAKTVTNNIDLSGEGGLVWRKGRDVSNFHLLSDTEMGASGSYLTTVTGSNVNPDADAVATFNNDGFTTGALTGTREWVNWTFRKAPKFFDIVTYTGDGVAGREIAHNLGAVPGFIVVKKTNDWGDWVVQHRSLGAQGSGNIRLNSTDNAISNGQHYWGNGTVGIDPTSSVFTVDNHTWVNNNGDNYVAYLFAHNDGDGGFGADGDADIIKCGSYTGNGSTNGPEIDLGFEPQWIMIKPSSISGFWTMFDSMRGMTANGAASGNRFLQAQASSPEYDFYSDYYSAGSFDVTSTGFKLTGNQSVLNGGSQTYIYIAIRRGTKVPESGTEVFNVDITATAASGSTPSYVSGFPVDMGLYRRRSTTAFWSAGSRLTGGRALNPASTDAEYGDSEMQYDYMTGWKQQDGYAISDQTAWMWKRAPGYFDVVAYTSNVSSGSPITLNHNLNAAPEMMWCKKRSGGQNWFVYHKDSGYGSGGYLHLNKTNSAAADSNLWNSTDPTETTFTVGSFLTTENSTYIAYLFASLPGISKVGSYTGNGSSQTINCDFTSGARFILIKRTDNSGDWYIWDSVRGIVTGSDPHLALNTTAAELTYRDSIDPNNSGFIVNETANSNINVSSASYIFYAIA